ncbi:hypothetical protein EYF80_057685 [Liparis tanakae]|uniref:Uncharacterized protein n=1 Tax=Liparis tanakae TaxID=230148 RepID=A0A4Z2EU45_9TELE|nr:hypothetical protein EYF80_057685 [Liparis tanakae]
MPPPALVHFPDEVKFILKEPRLHANGSVQSDDLAVDHGVLSQRCHQVGKLRGVSQARGEGHLSGEKGLHLLWETGQEGGGEQTYGNKERQHLRCIHGGQIPPDGVQT